MAISGLIRLSTWLWNREPCIRPATTASLIHKYLKFKWNWHFEFGRCHPFFIRGLQVTPRDDWREWRDISDPARRRCQWSYAYPHVINIHFLESTLITELKFHFCFSQVQWLIDNYETDEGVSLVHVPPCTPIIWDTAMSTSCSQSMRQTDPFRFFLGLRTRRLGTRLKHFIWFLKSFQIEFINFFMEKQRQFQVSPITSFAYQTDVVAESNVGRGIESAQRPAAFIQR